MYKNRQIDILVAREPDYKARGPGFDPPLG